MHQLVIGHWKPLEGGRVTLSRVFLSREILSKELNLNFVSCQYFQLENKVFSHESIYVFVVEEGITEKHTAASTTH